MSSMFKKRGGLAFKPKISRRPQPASLSTPQQSSVVDNVKEAAVAGADTSSDGPSITQTTIQSSTSNHTAPPQSPLPLSASANEEENRNAPQADQKSDNTPPHAETRAQTATYVIEVEDPPAETTARPCDLQRKPADQSAHEVIPTASFIGQEATAAPDAQVERRHSEQSPAASTQAIETCTDLAVTETDDTPSVPVSAPSRQRKRLTQSSTTKNKAAKATPSEPAQPKKRQRRPQRTQAGGEEQQDGEGDSEVVPKKRSRKTKEGAQAKPRRARSVTPEDAESQLVDHQKLTMADLTRDLHIGKKFSRHDELRERERQARAKAKAGKNSDGDGDGNDGDAEADGSNPDNSGNNDHALRTAPSNSGEQQQQQQGSGVQFRMVDGQIVLDQSSLVMDRHARAAAAQRDMETIEENDFTRLITSSSYMSSSKLRGPNVWSAEETVLFYRGLEMFGTDFEIIARMFPGKQRRQVKLKFNREERHNPKLVDAALIGVKKTRMNMEEYKALTGGEFESVESIEAQHREQEEHFEARQKQIADEQAEIMRKKKEELFADDNGNGGGSGEGSRKNKGKGKRRGADSAALGDPEVIMDL